MIILVDNYDSFTYNLYQLLGEIGEKVVVFRNDEVNKKIIQDLLPDAIVISPGPCAPNQAGKSMEIIDLFSKGFTASTTFSCISKLYFSALAIAKSALILMKFSRS